MVCRRLADVSRSTRALSLVPEGRGGLLTFTAAKLAAKLKVCCACVRRSVLCLTWADYATTQRRLSAMLQINDTAGLPSVHSGADGVDAQLASAQSSLTAGELLAAAQRIEEAAAGSAASPAVAEWVAQV